MSIKRAVAPVLPVLVLVLSAVVLAKGAAPPKHDAACQTASDCGFTHMDEGCCWECGARVGSGAWVRAHEAFCNAHPGKGCRVPACGQAYVRPACKQGRCTP